MIPGDKQPILDRALEAAFGGARPEHLEPLAASDGLAGTQSYRMVVGGRAYLLRFGKETNPGIDPAREHAFTRAAAEAGIAPRVWYASVDDRIMVTDFVATAGYPPDAAVQLAGLLRRVHGLVLPGSTARFPGALDGFVRRLAGSTLFDAADLAALLAAYDRVVAAYPHDEEAWVPCHNDLKPQNVLSDGTRLVLVDWEAAFPNDRYADLAMAASFFALAPAEEAGFLAAYFGAPADAGQRARFVLRTVMMHAFYVAVFGAIAGRGGATRLDGPPAMAFEAFQRGLVAGTVDLATPVAKLAYARSHLERALALAPRLDAALGLAT